MNALTNNDRTLIGSLRRSSVEKAMIGLKPSLENARWLDATNHYLTDVVKRLRNDPATTKEEGDLSKYIAASSCLHVNDGWSYLGRAVSCLIAGDSHRALHLGYYAELRAAMSLLAASGIGVFNTDHFAISPTGRIRKFETTKGTHIFSWLALNVWAEQQFSGLLFSNIICPEGKTLGSKPNQVVE